MLISPPWNNTYSNPELSNVISCTLFLPETEVRGPLIVVTVAEGFSRFDNLKRPVLLKGIFNGEDLNLYLDNIASPTWLGKISEFIPKELKGASPHELEISQIDLKWSSTSYYSKHVFWLSFH